MKHSPGMTPLCIFVGLNDHKYVFIFRNIDKTVSSLKFSFSPPRDLPGSGIKPTSLVFPALAGKFFTTESPGRLAVIRAAAAESLQSCLTLCDPRDGSPTGSLVPGILQARTLEWVAISFSNA